MADILNQTTVLIQQTLSNAFAIPNLRETILPLFLYTAGIVIFSIIIWHGYRFIATRDIITLDLSKYDVGRHPRLAKFVATNIFIIKFLVVFPLITFSTFAGLGLLLFFLSKTAQVETILLTSITLISAIRATAYYSDDLSKDLAKLIPFYILGVFVLDPSFFSLDLVVERVGQLPSLLPVLTTYLSFTVILELVLKTLHFLFLKLSPQETSDI